jgi:cytochrome c553
MNPIKFLSVAFMVLGAAFGANAQETAMPQSKGEYLARAADCVSCHSAAAGNAVRRSYPVTISRDSALDAASVATVTV